MASRVLIVGNSGSGKTTLARRESARDGLAHLDLDSLAWLPTTPPIRRPVAESVVAIGRFTAIHDAWVIEGCYADLAAAIGDQATELVFLNPGVEACVRHCLARPWEPHKYESREAQDRNLERLVAWVRAYTDRDDACSLSAHRRLFAAFPGSKREVATPP